MSSVSSGSSLYSDGLTTCASTRAKSEPKVRREAGLFTVVGLSHAEDVANRATRGIADHHEAACQQTEAEDAAFAIVLACVLNLDRHALKDRFGVLEVQAPFGQCPFAFCGIVGDAHNIIVFTKTVCGNTLAFGVSGLQIQSRLAIANSRTSTDNQACWSSDVEIVQGL